MRLRVPDAFQTQDAGCTKGRTYSRTYKAQDVQQDVQQNVQRATSVALCVSGPRECRQTGILNRGSRMAAFQLNQVRLLEEPLTTSTSRSAADATQALVQGIYGLDEHRRGHWWKRPAWKAWQKLRYPVPAGPARHPAVCPWLRFYASRQPCQRTFRNRQIRLFAHSDARGQCSGRP